MAGNDKAQRYISSLETARLNGSWSEFPELLRKVTKHAPQRKVLISTATAEHAVISKIAAGSDRPPTSASSDARALPECINNLEAALKSETLTPDESIQGQACLLWARWTEGGRSEDLLALAERTNVNTSSTSGDSKWTKVCLVKVAFIRASIYAQSKQSTKSEAICKELLPWLTANRDQMASIPQFQYWAAQLLALAAMSSEKESSDTVDALPMFRQWSQSAAKGVDEPPSKYGNCGASIPRSGIWQQYYKLLSQVLGRSMQEPKLSRLATAEEFRLVQTSYESELLKRSTFPKATESNAAIEEWVEQVIRNWQILCGSQWQESDLGAGGRNSTARNVLDILYRAAMKTFHSTLILRRLFEVHKYLTEFDLAYHALDTYIEYIDRGRARAAKSNRPVVGQDNDEIVARTIADGIEGLCSFGRQAEAEKAYELCKRLNSLVTELGGGLPKSGTHQVDRYVNGDSHERPTLSKLTKGITHRALGIGHAHWARWTSFNERRSPLQSTALLHLKFAVSQNLSSDQQIRSLHALVFLLAETREADQAIDYAKQALSLSISTSASDTTYTHQRQLLPMWHLMALLLTSRQEFDMASQSCAAAFEQFPSSEALFGSRISQKVKNEKASRTHGLIDDMECHELERLIEVELSELALTELREGPDHAVNSTNDILGLFSRLFGFLDVAGEALIVKTNDSPSTTNLARRLSRASFFGRRKASVMSEAGQSPRMASQTSEHVRPATDGSQLGLAPTITITGEDGQNATSNNRKPARSDEPGRRTSLTRDRVSRLVHKAEPHLHRNKERKSSQAASELSSQRQSFETSQEQQSNPELTRPPLHTIPSGVEVPTNDILSDHEDSPEAKQELNTVSHNMSHNSIAAPASHEEQPPKQDVRLPTVRSETTVTSPTPRFPQATSQRYALTILVKIWLVIARLYRRANMFEDSREANGEAAKAATKIEKLVSAVESSARAFADAGWGGGGKSCDEVWADIYCERAELLLASTKIIEDVGGQADNQDVRDAVEQFELCLMHFPDHPGGIIGLSNVLLDYYERKVELGQKVDDGRVLIAAATDINNGRRKTGNWANDTTQANGMGYPSTSTVLVPAVSHAQDLPVNPNGPFVPNTNIPTIRVDRSSRLSWSDSTTLRSETAKALARQHSEPLPPGPSREAQAQVQRVYDERDELRKTPENLNRLAARDRAYGLLSTLTKLGIGWDNSEAWFALARAHELGGEMEKAKDILWWCVRLEDTRPIRHWRNIGSGGYVLI